METGYQRGKIQEESLYYEHKKHDGSYPIVGVNTFRSKQGDHGPAKIELARSTEEEKQSQLKRLSEFHGRNAAAAPKALERLKRVVIENGNVFAELMKTVRVCSLASRPCTKKPLNAGVIHGRRTDEIARGLRCIVQGLSGSNGGAGASRRACLPGPA